MLDYKMDLNTKSGSVDFYNDRYNNGYMIDWPLERKLRIVKIIKEMNLPGKGEALDYGCGNGVFTALIKKILPYWNVYGIDISEISVRNASKLNTDCTFFCADDKALVDKKFDFIFSHHVLEHVYDIDKCCEEVSSMLNSNGYMLHIMPCGNEGSFEYNLCSKIENGINRGMQNRFFFEDEGHLRRLKSKELADKFKVYNINIIYASYANQYYGALDWITDCDPNFIYKITEINKAKGITNKLILYLIRTKLLLLQKAKYVKIFYDRIPLKANTLILMVKFPWKFSKLFIAKNICHYYKAMADSEWKHKSKQENGSEMFLCFNAKRIKL
ncbi:MAG: class I SAM-dependent methyltransferase [Bacteroidia bacterium]